MRPDELVAVIKSDRKIEVELCSRKLTINQLDLTNTTALNEYNRLKKGSIDGDTNSQYLLGVILYRCIIAPRNKHSLEKMINDGYQERANGYQHEQGLIHSYKFCEGVTDDMLNLSIKLIESAAESGNVLAMNTFSVMATIDENLDGNELEKAIKEYRKKRDNYLQISMQKGSVYALIAKGLDFYLSETHKIQAYAYLKVANTYQPSKSFENLMTAIRNDIYEYEIYEAEALFKEMVEEFGTTEGVKLIQKNSRN
ncbi:hypothetical protein [Thalassotalea sp. ND16A]|uniref:hypothetical protein n=1 Tax=Thalassotalea sp. ND16A TaxID=1535422 RepID=UPI00051A524A|nr:hypothetical protein [Thalassotalea sp. ND16A]KGJ96676.1 hypothetical protein ND16A_1029 [Thalassotalea sp. ND16A]